MLPVIHEERQVFEYGRDVVLGSRLACSEKFTRLKEKE